MQRFVLEPGKKESFVIIIVGAVLALFFIFGVAWQVWPELSDATAPELRVEGIEEGERYNGRLSVTFTADEDVTAVSRVVMELDERVVYDKPIGEKHFFDGALIETAGLKEGEHRFRITAHDASCWKQTGHFSCAFVIDRTPPVLSLTPIKDVVLQGDTGGFFIQADEKLAGLSLMAAGRTLPCYTVPGRTNVYRGLFPVRVFTAPADYEVLFTAKDLAGNVTRTSGTYRVAYRAFPKEVIQVPKAKAGILTNTRKLNEDAEKIKAALAERGAVQYWRGTFLRPVVGIESSPFGIQRVYTTGSIASFHRGIDIANKEGTEVRAANTGAVLLAEELFLYGNTIILDHGQGVLTYYCHLSQLDVGKGDIVAGGQVIGAIGTTGLSTGPHLHWEMQIEGIEVNPADWMTVSFEE